MQRIKVFTLHSILGGVGVWCVYIDNKQLRRSGDDAPGQSMSVNVAVSPLGPVSCVALPQSYTCYLVSVVMTTAL